MSYVGNMATLYKDVLPSKSPPCRKKPLHIPCCNVSTRAAHDNVRFSREHFEFAMFNSFGLNPQASVSSDNDFSFIPYKTELPNSHLSLNPLKPINLSTSLCIVTR